MVQLINVNNKLNILLIMILAGSASQTNRTSRTSCNEDEIISNLADIQIINPESILSLAIDNSFSMCKDVAQTIQTLLKYVKECEGTLSENDLYVSLIRGLESMYKKMCENPDFLKGKQIPLAR